VIFVVLMALPAMPLPTGGISHFFEIIVALLALEMVVGRRSIWLPSSWKKRPLSKTIVKKGIPYLVKKIAIVERYSKPRLTNVTTSRLALPLLGLIIIAFTVTAFIAPPFSGLDTLPALGVVLISLGLILEDALGLVLGTIVGCLGVFLVVGIGSAVFNAIF
nr:exopolysaccharide biosynthesis protein [Candidatus Saccharibacteria bacterium]